MERRLHRTPDPLVNYYLLVILDIPALRGRLRARALVEHVQALIEHEPVVTVAITVNLVFVAVLGVDEIEAKAGEDPVSPRAAVEGVVALISVESVWTGATRELVGCAPADEQVARAEAQEGVLTHIVSVGAEELVGLVVAEAQRRQGHPAARASISSPNATIINARFILSSLPVRVALGGDNGVYGPNHRGSAEERASPK